MKARIVLLILVLGLMCATAALAACTAVNNTDFQGTVCNNGTAGETRQGVWVDEDGGVLIGDGAVYLNPSSTVAREVRKQGQYKSYSIDAVVLYDEVKLTSGGTNGYKKLDGREVLPDGGTFIGTKEVLTNPSTSVAQEVRKQGKISGPVFEGTQLFDEVKFTSGSSNGYEKLDGREILADGGTFIGTKEVLINPSTSVAQEVRKQGKVVSGEFSGTTLYSEVRATSGTLTSYEKKEGTWRIYPGMKYGGSITITKNANGTVTVSDLRKRVY